MFRRTLPAVALTGLALLAAAFALNRPGERLAIAIDRIAKIPIPGGVPNTFEVQVEGRVLNPRASYVRPTSATLAVDYGRPLQDGPYAGSMTVQVFLSIDPAAGRFRGSGSFDFPPDHPPKSFRVELHDDVQRVYSRRLTFDP